MTQTNVTAVYMAKVKVIHVNVTQVHTVQVLMTQVKVNLHDYSLEIQVYVTLAEVTTAYVTFPSFEVLFSSFTRQTYTPESMSSFIGSATGLDCVRSNTSSIKVQDGGRMK